MEVKSRVKRNDKIAVMFSSDMRSRLSVIAEAFGMPPSTLCAFAVASWVQQQERSLSMAREAIQSIADKAGELIEPELVNKCATASLIEVNRHLDAQGLLPLPDGS